MRQLRSVGSEILSEHRECILPFGLPFEKMLIKSHFLDLSGNNKNEILNLRKNKLESKTVLFRGRFLRILINLTWRLYLI